MAITPLEISFAAIRRGRRMVLEPARFTLPAGRGIGVIGLNGAGKTSLLMAAAGLLRGADLRLNGKPVTEAVVAYAPQNAPLPSWVRVHDLFALFNTTFEEASRTCPGLRLEELDNLSVRQLTPGQKQGLIAAIALVLDAELFALDEPFSGLDFHRQSALRAGLAGIAASRTVIVSAQSITDLLEICDRFIVLREGRVVFAGHMRDLGLAADPATAEVEKVMLELVLGESAIRA